MKAPFPARDYLTGDTFMVSPTPEGWWTTTPSPADLSRYYPPVYYGGHGGRRFPRWVEWGQRWLYRRRARWVTRVLGRVGRVLDVGCGPGHLLARFRELGWDTLGTEATESAAERARATHGLEVRAGELGTLGFSDDEFDAVVSWHTLEHMREPGCGLDEMSRVLKPGGLLLVSVPDFGSPEAQSMPAAWFHLDVPRHLTHWPSEVLRAQLRRRGFEVVAESFFAPEYDTFSLVQTWQNRMGWPGNLLYLRIKSASGAGGTASWHQRMGVWLVAGLLVPWAMWVALWRTWRKRGAVIVILARKASR